MTRSFVGFLFTCGEESRYGAGFGNNLLKLANQAIHQLLFWYLDILAILPQKGLP